MDRRERANELETALRAALGGFQVGLWTAMPAELQSFDPAKMTCTAQITVQALVERTRGTWTNETMPLCTDCPVIFPGGGGFSITFPLAKGDEGLLVFASRCIDQWHAQGGVQPQAERRMHDLSDGFFIPGVRSRGRVIPNISPGAATLRTDDGLVVVQIEQGGRAQITAPLGLTVVGPLTVQGPFTMDAPGAAGSAIINAPGGVTVNGPMAVNGDSAVTGNVSASGIVSAPQVAGGEVTANGVPLGTHHHTAPAGGGNTGPPLATP